MTSLYKESKFEEGSLRDVLKRGTKDVHSVADALFTDQLVKKKISLKTYQAFLSQLYFVYSAMEEELDRHKDHPIVGPVHFPDELSRKEHIEQDLVYYHGVTWERDVTCLQATKDYVTRLHEIAARDPQLLIAHAYVRYLGDVSGGQILKKIIRRMYGLPLDGNGLQFYEFQNMDDIPKFKEFYSGRMNSLDLDDAGKQAILEEAKMAFTCNIGIFQEIVALAENSPDGYMPKDNNTSNDNVKGCPVVHGNQGNAATCPFSKLRAGRNKAAMFAMTSASGVAVLFAMMMSYCPWVHRSEWM